MMRIAILEDEEDQAYLLSRWLEGVACEVKCFALGAEIVRALKSDHLDMVLLDWNVPDMDGMAVLDWIRHQLGWTLPVIFITGRDEEESVVRALTAGADDYLVKPLSKAVFLARVKTLARRSGIDAPADDDLNAGGIRFVRRMRCCEVGGHEVPLTAREYDLALYFFEHLGEILPRVTLLRQVWGSSAELKTRTVDTHVSRIRQKLDLHPENGWRLQSVYQYGYRLENTLQI